MWNCIRFNFHQGIYLSALNCYFSVFYTALFHFPKQNHASLQGNVEMFSCTYTSCLFFLSKSHTDWFIFQKMETFTCAQPVTTIFLAMHPHHLLQYVVRMLKLTEYQIDITTAANANCLPGKTVTKIESSYDITHFLWGGWRGGAQLEWVTSSVRKF